MFKNCKSIKGIPKNFQLILNSKNKNFNIINSKYNIQKNDEINEIKKEKNWIN